MSNIYARITPLKSSSGGVKGRIEYISDPERQEDIVSFHSTIDQKMWEQLSAERKADNKSSGQYESCIEAKELTIALPHSYFAAASKEQLADQLAADFEKTYKVPCAVAVHRKGSGKNVHAHIVFSESELLSEPDIKIASRNMFYDENGKHCRTKKEILGEDGQIRPGCRILKKGEVYKTKYFKGKREDLKSNKNAHVFKQHYAEMLDLKVFDRDSYQLAQIKYGKGNPKENEIKEYNAGVQEYNRAVSEGIKKGVIAKEEAKLNTSALRDLRKRHRPVPGEEKIRYTSRLERILTAIDTLKEDLHAKLDKIAQKANMSLSMGIEKKPSVKEQLDRARQYKDPETEQPKFINQGLSPRKKSVRDQLRGHRDRDDKLEPRKKADKGWDMDR